jgi:serine/threonine-protein kinase
MTTTALTQFGQYLLLKKLATGGMAELFLGKQLGIPGFEKPLVLKRILPHLSENDEFSTMFLDEARVAARLNHPRIVQIFDLGKEGDAYFIAMEYIRGQDLRKIVKRSQTLRERIPAGLAVQILVGVLEGLDHAHRKTDERGRPLNIVHRDVSPQNILVSYEGDVKLVDFGIAKASTQIYQTRVGILKGKYAYMSPEQAQGKPVDRRSDIFAAGILLWEITTGQRLFRQSSEIETLRKVIDCVIEKPSSVDPEVPPELEAIVLRALEREPAARYQDAREMQLALGDYLKSRGMVASSARLAEYMRRLFPREIEVASEEVRILLEARPDTPIPPLPMPPEQPQSDHRTPASSSRSAPVSAATGGSAKSLPPPVPPPLPSATAPGVRAVAPTSVAPSEPARSGVEPTPLASRGLWSRFGAFARRPLDPQKRRLTLLVVTIAAVAIAVTIVVRHASRMRLRIQTRPAPAGVAPPTPRPAAPPSALAPAPPPGPTQASPSVPPSAAAPR